MMPTDLSGCTVWLDASQLTQADGVSIGSQWSDLSGGGHHGTVVGSPSPIVRAGANGLNGLRVVRFKPDEGRIRGDGMIATSGMSDLTVIYIGRLYDYHGGGGANFGRIFSNVYPPYNFLVGVHSSAPNSCYDNGWVNSGGTWTAPYNTPWTMWGFTFTGTGPVSTFYIDGVASGTAGTSSGHDSHWNLSGYDATGTQETCECEVAELITYNRKLSDSERVQVEDYLYAKWFVPPLTPAPLTGAGSLSATVKPIYPMSLNLLSTGQLQTAITIPGAEPPGAGGGWTADPNPPPPQRKYGPGWTTNGGMTTLVRPGGWFSLIERVTGDNGNGTLTATLNPILPDVLASFSGNGNLLFTLVIRNYRGAEFSGLGLPTSKVYEIKTIGMAYFTGNGEYGASSINDGLTAIIQVGYAVNFSGGGALLTDVEGGIQYSDGLSAIAIGRYLIPAYFDSVGQLLAFSGEVSIALAGLIGSGALTTQTTQQIYSLMVSLASNGTLSAPAFATYQTLVNLLGTGQLSAPAFANYLTSVGFTGAGALTALLVASYRQAGEAGGVGTITALISQRYNLLANLSGGGDLDVDIEGAVNVEEIDAFFDADGTFDAEAYGLINEMFAILLSEGTLSAAAFSVYEQVAALSSDGALTASNLAVYQQVASLFGGSVLYAESFIKYAASLGLSGAGVLAVLAWELEQSSATAGGTGTIAATIVQKYPLLVPFSGGGILSSPEFFDATYPDGLSARIGRSYGAFLNGDGVLTAGSYMYQIASATMLSGASALSAEAFASMQSSSALSGIGVFSETHFAVYKAMSNFVASPGFENDTAWQYFTDGEQSTEQAHSGAKSRKFTSIANYIQLLLTNEPGGLGYGVFPITAPGNTLYLEAWLRRGSSNTDTGVVFLRIQPRDAAAAELGFPIAYIPQTEISKIGWTKFSVEITVPATAVDFYAAFLIDVGVPAGDVFYLDDVSLVENYGARLTGTGALTASAQGFVPVPRSAALSGSGTLSATVAFPVNSPTTDTKTTVGAYTYLIPYWARYIDVVMIGGGAGGSGGQNFGGNDGKGGNAGVWDTTTWERGAHIPWSTTQVTGTVGNFGSAGAANGGASGAGTATTTNAVAGGSGARSAAGGASVSGTGGTSQGTSPGNVTVQGVVYTGGTGGSGGSSPGGTGTAPGAGGGGGNNNTFGTGQAGGPGARGQVWFRAYQ